MRYIHNTSFIVNDDAVKDWLGFMKSEYIPSIDGLGLCSDIIFTKVSIDQPEGKTFSLQLVFPLKKEMDLYLEVFMEKTDFPLIQKFKNRYLCFNSVLTEL